MTRVIHTGDTHLGYRQYHRPERRGDFLDAFRQVVDDAVEMDVDAVVHAGDLFHDRRPGLPDLLGTIDVLERLHDADIPFLAIVGNHEAKRDAQWLDLFEAMGLATRLGDDPVVVGETAFYGLDFVPRSQREDLDYAFTPHDAGAAALVSHGLFDPLVPDYGNVEWDARAVLDAATVDFDAMLLGDEHAATRKEVDGVWVTYCGSTERTSVDERDDRGYNVVRFDAAADTVHISRRGIETRRFVYVDLDLGEREGFERVRDRLREHDLTDAVVHVSLSGDGEDVSAARVESFATEEGALVARVKDHREVSEEVDLSVAFADPDEAVRERVRDLGLSQAARRLDETIRESKVADSNVADEVERAVTELLDEPSAFDGSPDETATGAESMADRLQSPGETDVDSTAPGDEASPDLAGSDAVKEADSEEVDSEEMADEADSEGADSKASADEGVAEADSEETADEAVVAETTSSGESDGQASMEDYL